jgi:MOSC domain-containing protein YiiM
MPSDQIETPHGKIFQINLSKGGVPKLAQRQALVTRLGLQGDEHRDLKHHGGPERALCLYSLERILALQEEGHPIFPGSAGENLTLSGLDWERVKPGARLHLGREVLIEITNYTVPCNNIRLSFVDQKFIRIDQDRFPGWSRAYARVIQDGEILTGDAVTFA